MTSFLAHHLRLIFARDPLFFAAWFAVFGICLANSFGANVWIWWSMAGLAGAACLGMAKLRWLVLLSIAFGFAGWHQVRQIDSKHLEVIWAERDPDAAVEVTLEATVVEQPFLTRMGDRALLTLRLDHLEQGERTVSTRDRIRLWASSEYRQGDRIRAEGTLTQLSAPRNPGEFSRRDYARDTNGVIAELRVSSHHRIQRIGHSSWQGLFQYALIAREWVGDAITRGLPADSPQAGVLRAMVLGARSEADPEAEEPFRLSGSLHIFAVSGLHVGIFGMVIWMLLQTVRVPRRIAIAVIIVSVLAYAFVTGLRPSAVRAALMMTVFLAGFWFRRKPRLLNSLGLAALLIFLFDTRQLFAVGFQLSFCVLMAIGLLAPFLRQRLHQAIEPDAFIPASFINPWHQLAISFGRRVADIFSISAAAWLGSLPFIWWYFGLITPVALLANCFLVPIAWLVICFATISMVAVGTKLVFIGTWLNQFNAWLVLMLQQTALFFAQIPGGHYQVTPLSDFFPFERNEVGITVFDLGRSCGPQAIHLRDEKSGKPITWLIDCGSQNGYASVIRPWIREQGIRRLDGFIATHGDNAHVGAGPELLTDYSPSQLVTSQLPSMSQAYRNLKAAKLELGTSPIQIAGGTGLQLNDEAKINVLFPPSHYADLSMSDDECLVLMIEWAGFRILSMSDSGFLTEKWLLANVPDLQADVLLKSHHTSDFSGLEEFLIAVNPKAVISTNDPFPANQWIREDWREMVTQRKIHLFDQAETGAVQIRLADEELVLRGFVNGQELRIPNGQRR